jgi:myo-inositol-1-phosphate synthase
MSDKIKVAIVGLGNCASSLVQGVKYYEDARENEAVPGLMHVNLGGYHIKDLKFVAAFDVNANKVGKDIGEAILAEPNNADVFSEVGKLGAKVYKAPVMDGINKYLEEVIPISEEKPVDVVEVLKETGAEMVVNYLPVGSEKAARFWAEVCLEAGIGFVNCMPVFIASDPKWEYRFRKAGLPVIGDDVKSQVGATIIHRTLVNLFLDRGMPIDKTYQLNTGGNCDFRNMLERDRLKSKKISKTNSVSSQIRARGQDIKDDDIHVGPSDYLPWQKDNKICFIRIESRNFGDRPHHVDLRLSVADSPNSGGVVIDAIRCLKLALNNNLSGAIDAPSSYFMKSPPKQFEDTDAKEMVKDFIIENGLKE